MLQPQLILHTLFYQTAEFIIRDYGYMPIAYKKALIISKTNLKIDPSYFLTSVPLEYTTIEATMYPIGVSLCKV